MTRVAVIGFAVAAAAVIEALAVLRGPDLLMAAAAIPVAYAMFQLTVSLRDRGAGAPEDLPEEMENGPAEMLQRWQARAQMLADRAEGTRADWDRHLRPLLAKEFELSTGLRVAKNRKATETAGLLQFGPELWRWVDPANSALRDQVTRAPGRATLDEILRLLQRL
ncbi:hypothetical protein ACWEKT_17810 [Nocardia takedensis]